MRKASYRKLYRKIQLLLNTHTNKLLHRCSWQHRAVTLVSGGQGFGLVDVPRVASLVTVAFT